MLNFIKKIWDSFMNLFKVDGNLSIDINNIYINGVKSDLSICNISDTDYYKLLVEDKCEDNVLYIVSSDFSNAYGKQLKNLAAPIAADDAATKEYVDCQVSALSSRQYVSRDEVVQIAKDVFKSSLQSILSAI